MTTLSQKTGSLLHFQRNTHTFFAKCDKNKKPVTIIRTAVIACANKTLSKRYIHCVPKKTCDHVFDDKLK